MQASTLTGSGTEALTSRAELPSTGWMEQGQDLDPGEDPSTPNLGKADGMLRQGTFS